MQKKGRISGNLVTSGCTAALCAGATHRKAVPRGAKHHLCRFPV
jgi:hypothetical protein